ncbi:MAG TPA: SpoIIE family protein phosphatase, partial [Gemmataceae bacterium]|nr:SpoIIE family protein phosphatase [Gemmataceae bacterium]
VEDLGSSNGTYLNGQRVEGRRRLTEQDRLQIGPYVLALQPDAPAGTPDPDEPIIRVSVAAQPTNHTLFTDNPAYKLQVVLEIAQHLARTPEKSLLAKLLEHLLELFPQADRGLVVLCADGDVERLRVAESAVRLGAKGSSTGYSRTIARRALEGGLGILSEDVPRDRQMLIHTVMALEARSLLCVPMISKDGRRLGVIHLDATRPGAPFRRDDLEVLTAIGMQAAVALDNAALHVELLRDERLRAEVGMARDIQRGFLPRNFPQGGEGFELYALVEPALEVSGDLYDFFRLSDGRLAFYVGDVSGKGMPAALFMAAVHALFRHLSLTEISPAATLARLDAALAADNPSDKYVTVAMGLYDPPTGETTLAVAAHPPPLLRRVNGRVEEVAVQPALPLGYGEITGRISEHRFTLGTGETLILYTDGFSEARVPGGKAIFDRQRLQEILGGPRAALSLEACADAARAAVSEFIGGSDQQDDLTMLLLRRK